MQILTIKDESGSALPGVKVSLYPTFMSVMSDDEGNYEFSKVPEGEYVLSASLVGHEAGYSIITLKGDMTQDVSMNLTTYKAESVIVKATRVSYSTPVPSSYVSKSEIQKRNLGQDLPMLVRMTPSVVTTSDAGAGIGYTGMRIRGSDASRVNVTINGVPLNDPESQGVFWVNMPDFSSSLNSIQIQRGIGTSTNGAGAFGATINLETDRVSKRAFAEVNNTYGSFNSRKHNVEFGTGLIKDHWAITGRASAIHSDGYIDRASSDLSSYFLQASYQNEKTFVKLLTFAGHERTYQAWWGTPEAKITGDIDALTTHYWNNAGSYPTPEDSAYLFDSDRRYNYYSYENEVDNYNQDHYQLHVSHKFNGNLSFTGALHYTYGRGYFEQYRRDDDMADYGIDPISFSAPGDTIFIPNPIIPGDTLFFDVIGDTSYEITSTDLIRRRWLDNHFYGGTFAFNYWNNKLDLTVGGAVNQYVGDHFGEVIWAEYANNLDYEGRYYDNTATKNDANVYAKAIYKINPQLNLFGDLQARSIGYTATGPDSDGRMIDVDADFMFFNPKAGVNYFINESHRVFGSFAMAGREPVRNDFIDADSAEVPMHETMMDIELGYQFTRSRVEIGLNAYYMMYDNQLVLTGELNDVGTPVRTNVDDSYRAGVELTWSARITPKFFWNGNATLSQNKIAEFTETIYDYGNGGVVENTYTNSDISFSPSIIAANIFSYSPVKNMFLTLQTKYAGKQYLDNTSSDSKSIDPYLVNDFLMSYSIYPEWMQEIRFQVMVNNFLNTMYSSNGYTYSYIWGDTITENFLYPQAGINFLGSVALRF